MPTPDNRSTAEPEELEESYRAIFEQSADAILLTALDGSIHAANPAACRMFGRTEAEILEAGRSGLVDASDPRLPALLAQRAATGKAAGELRMLRRDGTSFPGEVSSVIFTNAAGQSRTSMIIRDVTEQRRGEAALRASEERLRAIADYTAALECWFAPDGRLLWVNPAVEPITGYSVAECLALPGFPTPLFPPDEAERCRAGFQEALRGSRGSDRQLRFLRKDGAERWGSISWQPIYSSDGAPLGLRTSLRDVTERKRLEAALKASEARYRAVVEDQTELICRYKTDHTLTFVNEVYCRFFGKTGQELLGTKWQPQAVAGDLPMIEAKLRALSPANPVVVIENRVRSGSGEVRWMQFVNRGFFDASGRLVETQAVGRDITERKREQEALADHQRRLQALAVELSVAEQHERRRVAALLHDDVIQSLALAKIRLGAAAQSASSAEGAAALGEIRKLVEQIIESARSLTYQLSPPILHELGLEAALDWLADQFTKHHDLPCRFEDDGQPKPMDEHIRTLLFADVRELLHNVAKHAKATHATVRARKESATIRITVEDDGVGFDASRIVRADKTIGFGLFNLRERLGCLGGRCEIQSQPYGGTKVDLIAPLNRG